MKQGDLVYHRITGEEMIVNQVRTANDLRLFKKSGGDDPLTVSVHRVKTRHGRNSYISETFFVYELTTDDG